MENLCGHLSYKIVTLNCIKFNAFSIRIVCFHIQQVAFDESHLIGFVRCINTWKCKCTMQFENPVASQVTKPLLSHSVPYNS